MFTHFFRCSLCHSSTFYCHCMKENSKYSMQLECSVTDGSSTCTAIIRNSSYIWMIICGDEQESLECEKRALSIPSNFFYPREIPKEWIWLKPLLTTNKIYR